MAQDGSQPVNNSYSFNPAIQDEIVSISKLGPVILGHVLSEPISGRKEAERYPDALDNGKLRAWAFDEKTQDNSKIAQYLEGHVASMESGQAEKLQHKIEDLKNAGYGFTDSDRAVVRAVQTDLRAQELDHPPTPTHTAAMAALEKISRTIGNEPAFDYETAGPSAKSMAPQSQAAVVQKDGAATAAPFEHYRQDPGEYTVEPAVAKAQAFMNGLNALMKASGKDSGIDLGNAGPKKDGVTGIYEDKTFRSVIATEQLLGISPASGGITNEFMGKLESRIEQLSPKAQNFSPSPTDLGPAAQSRAASAQTSAPKIQPFSP